MTDDLLRALVFALESRVAVLERKMADEADIVPSEYVAPDDDCA